MAGPRRLCDGFGRMTRRLLEPNLLGFDADYLSAGRESCVLETGQHLLQRSFERGDSLHTSFLAYGEVMAGAIDSAEKSEMIRRTMEEMGFSYLPFDAGAVMPFSRLRAKNKLKAADAIHLASAASAGIDLFLTGDKQLIGVGDRCG